MSKSSKLKKRLAVATAALTLAVPSIGLADPITPTPGGPTPPPTPVTPTVDPSTVTYNIGVSTGLFNSLNSAMNILNWAQPLNFLGWSNNPSVPVSNQGAVSQSGEGSKGTNTQIITTGGGANDMWSGLKNIGDHVTLIETSTPKKRASSGGNLSEAVKAATEKEENVAKEYLDAVKSGDKAKTAELKDELIKATEEKWKAKDAEESAAREAELAKKTEAEQAAKEAAIKEAQEKADQAAKEGREAYDAWQKAQQETKDAAAKAEQAALAYLKALKSGDKLAIEAFKAELQKANEALVAAKNNEAAAKQAMSDASYKVSRTQTDLQNTQNRSYFGGAGGENQPTTQQQTVGQQTTQQTVEQPVQQSVQQTAQGNEDARTSSAGASDFKQFAEELRRYEESQQAQNTVDLAIVASKAQDNLSESVVDKYSDQYPGISQLVKDLQAYQQQQQQSDEQQGGEITVTTVREAEKEYDSLKWINDSVGEPLLTREANARQKLRSAQTSEERAEAMKELDEIHAEESKKLAEAVEKREQETQAAQQAARIEAARLNEEQVKAVGGEGLQKANDRLNEAQQKVNGLKNDLKGAESDRHNAFEEWRKAKEEGASPERLEELANKWREEDARCKTLEKDLAHAQLEQRDASENLERAEGISQEAKAETDKLQAEKAKAESNLAEKKAELAAKNAEHEKLKAEADSKQNELNKLDEDKKAAMEQASAQQQAEIAELQNAREGIDAEFMNGNMDEDRMEQLLEQRDALNARIDELNDAKTAAENAAGEQYEKDHAGQYEKLQAEAEAARKAEIMDKSVFEAQDAVREAEKAVAEAEQAEKSFAELTQLRINATPEELQRVESEEREARERYEQALNDANRAEGMEGRAEAQRNANQALSDYVKAYKTTQAVRDAANYQPGQK
ncbi:MAG: hypothetical protein E7199_02105 [Schwartzia succinivorans]|jgi:hypothetical protein|nr:hypothetical protein [Schwartzia succinivorans]